MPSNLEQILWNREGGIVIQPFGGAFALFLHLFNCANRSHKVFAEQKQASRMKRQRPVLWQAKLALNRTISVQPVHEQKPRFRAMPA